MQAKHPEFAKAYNRRGNTCREVCDYVGAIENYTKAVAFDPEYTEAYRNLGEANQLLGNFGEAVKCYTRR